MHTTKLLAAAAALAITGGLAIAQTSTPAAPAAPSASPPTAADAPAGPGAGPRGPGHGGRGGHGKRGDMLRHLDTDGDGQLSRAEMQAMHARQMQGFDAADANRDGKLDANEMRVMRETMRARMGEHGGGHGMPGGHGRHGGPSGTPPAPAAQPQG